MKLSTETNEEIQKRIEKNDEKWKIGKSVTCHLVIDETMSILKMNYLVYG